MRVLFLLDEIFGLRERPLIERLEVGLADDGIRIVRASPKTLVDAPSGGFFVETATFSLRGLVVSRRARARALLDAVAPTDDKPIDVIHAMGGAAWGFGATVARLRSCPLALEMWRTGLGVRARAVRSALAPDVPVALLCPSQGMVDELNASGFAEVTRLTPWGVHASDEQRTILDPSVAAGIVVVGSGRDARAMSGALEGISRALPPSNDTRIYIDAGAARRARIWPILQRLNLTERASLIEGIEDRRDLALHNDLMVVPESLGEHRSIVLDAMGSGMAVVAAADSRVSWLRDGTTAHVVAPAPGAGAAPVAEAWAEAMRRTLLRPEAARSLGASAREFVRANFRASEHVASVLAAYSALTNPGTAGSIGLGRSAT